jgi:hypothetical protein
MRRQMTVQGRTFSHPDQAISTGADPSRYGVVGQTATAQQPPTSTAALMNAAGPRND